VRRAGRAAARRNRCCVAPGRCYCGLKGGDNAAHPEDPDRDGTKHSYSKRYGRSSALPSLTAAWAARESRALSSAWRQCRCAVDRGHSAMGSQDRPKSDAARTPNRPSTRPLVPCSCGDVVDDQLRYEFIQRDSGPPRCLHRTETSGGHLIAPASLVRQASRPANSDIRLRRCTHDSTHYSRPRP